MWFSHDEDDDLNSCEYIASDLHRDLQIINRHIGHIQDAQRDCERSLSAIRRLRLSSEDHDELASQIKWRLEDYDDIFTRANYVLLNLRDTLWGRTGGG